MTRRIFVAIKASEELQEKISSWREMHKELHVLWTKNDNLHITLVPPWEEKRDIETVEGRLLPIKINPFTINFQDITLGPESDSPSLIWSEEASKSEDLKSLAGTMDRVLVHKMGKRIYPFRPHLTLARFRNTEVLNLSLQRAEGVNWEEEVHSFVLMESHITAEGTRYEVLKKFPLE